MDLNFEMEENVSTMGLSPGTVDQMFGVTLVTEKVWNWINNNKLKMTIFYHGIKISHSK